MARPKYHQVLFGGICSCFLLVIKFFGWFRSFDWLQRNAPRVYHSLDSQLVWWSLFCIVFGMTATGIREMWKQKHATPDPPPASPVPPDLGTKATAEQQAVAIGGNIQAGRDVHIVQHQPAPTHVPHLPVNEAVIDVSLTRKLGPDLLPLEIKPGEVGAVYNLCPTRNGAKYLNPIDNRKGSASIFWPSIQLLEGKRIPVVQFNLKNHGSVNLAHLEIDVLMHYGKKFPPNLQQDRSIIINHLDSGEELPIYVVNGCPLYSSIRFRPTAKAQLAGQTAISQFPLVHPAKHGYSFEPYYVNFMQMTCDECTSLYTTRQQHRL